MNRQEITDKIKDIIYQETEISTDEMTEDSYLIEDLDLSSLEVYRILSLLEAAFHIRIPTRESRFFSRISDITDYIQKSI